MTTKPGTQPHPKPSAPEPEPPPIIPSRDGTGPTEVLTMQHPVVAQLMAIIETRTAGEPLDLSSDEVKKIIAACDEAGDSVIYDKVHEATVEGQAQARHMSSEFLKAQGKHAAAANIRGEQAKEGFFVSIGQALDAPITGKKILWVVCIGGATYALYSGLAYAFRWRGGLFGQRAMPESYNMPVPM